MPLHLVAMAKAPSRRIQNIVRGSGIMTESVKFKEVEDDADFQVSPGQLKPTR
jgi:hypothetical protein